MAKIAAKKFKVNPCNLAACIALTDYLPAAILLYRIYIRSNLETTMTDSNGEDGWAVLTREEWMVDSGLTRRQLDKAIANLKKTKFIKYDYRKRSKKDKGSSILWVKTTSKTNKWIHQTVKVEPPMDSPNGELKYKMDSPNGELLINKKIGNKESGNKKVASQRLNEKSKVESSSSRVVEEESNVVDFKKEKELKNFSDKQKTGKAQNAISKKSTSFEDLGGKIK